MSTQADELNLFAVITHDIAAPHAGSPDSGTHHGHFGLSTQHSAGDGNGTQGYGSGNSGARGGQELAAAN
jgi:hypothetical protein